MQRVLICSVLGLTLAAGAACSRERRDANGRPSVADVARATDGDRLEVTGCLSSDPRTNQFVLTANSNTLSALTNRAAAGEAETFHYQLVGGGDLQSMVGKEVKVIGDVAGTGKDVDVKRTEKSAEATTPGSKDATAAVRTTEQIELQVERLNVASVAATGAPCQPMK
jgi:F0F1-type ATP synthase epsilon subunit